MFYFASLKIGNKAKYLFQTVLTDLSKAFDCIPHDLLIGNLHAYEVDKNSLAFLYSNLERRKQRVKMNNILNLLK